MLKHMLALTSTSPIFSVLEETLSGKRISAINFIWIGPPKLTAGGQDVTGIRALSNNIKKFGAIKNTVVFWCLDQHTDTYSDYFKKHAVDVSVKSIEKYLDGCTDRSKSQGSIFQALYVRDSLERLLYSEGRGRVSDFVCIKNLFFLFLLSREGGYVLDTNVQACDDQPVIFPEFDDYHCPTFIADEKIRYDTWMQYCPYNKRDKVEIAVEYYIKYYSQIVKNEENDSVYTLEKSGLSMRAVRQIEASHRGKTVADRQWYFERYNYGNCYSSLFGLEKEYYNSHRDRSQKYPDAFLHAAFGEFSRMVFDLEHGIDPGTVTGKCKYEEPDIFAQGETLFSFTVRHWCVHGDIKYYRCAERLLQDPATDVNTVYQIIAGNIVHYCSPLADTINSKFERGLHFLLKAGADVSMVLDNQSMLMLAVESDFGLEMLLKHGADPAQKWQGQKKTPLLLAVQKQNNKAVDLLLIFGADPLQMPDFQTSVYAAPDRMDTVLPEKLPARSDPDKLNKTDFSDTITSPECGAVPKKFPMKSPGEKRHLNHSEAFFKSVIKKPGDEILTGSCAGPYQKMSP